MRGGGWRAGPVSHLPVLEEQSRHTPELGGVVSHHGQSIGQCDGGDEHVVRADRAALLLERRADDP